MTAGTRYTGLIERYRDRLPVGADTRIDRLGGTEFWLRSVAGHPRLKYPGAFWRIWQYTGTGMMPGIKGDEFLAQVHDAHPDVLTVMLTGQAEARAIERAQREANLLACIHKPWDEIELLDLVGASLG